MTSTTDTSTHHDHDHDSDEDMVHYVAGCYELDFDDVLQIAEDYDFDEGLTDLFAAELAAKRGNGGDSE